MLERGQVDLDKFQAILDSLPLSESPLERCLISNVLGRRAPEGKAFEMTGHFYHGLNHRGFEMPDMSFAMFLDEHKSQYEFLLAEFGGDEGKARKALLDDLEEDGEEIPYLVDSFIGKWLVIDTECDSVRVLKEPQIWYSHGAEDKVSGFGPWNKDDPLKFWNPRLGSYGMRQEYAHAEIGKSKICLVDYEEEKKQLYIPEDQDDDANQLTIAQYDNGMPNSYAYSKYHSLGQEYTEEFRLGLMRRQRMLGLPLRDDPLRDFEFYRPQILTPDKPKIVCPKREPRRWIIKPGEEHLVERYRKIESGEIPF